MKTVIMSDEIFNEVKGYLQDQLNEARDFHGVVKDRFRYYGHFIEYRENLIGNLKYFKNKMKEYKIALKSFETKNDE